MIYTVKYPIKVKCFRREFPRLTLLNIFRTRIVAFEMLPKSIIQIERLEWSGGASISVVALLFRFHNQMKLIAHEAAIVVCNK